MLLALLLIPVIGSALVFAWKSPSAKYIALVLAFLEMALSFYMLRTRLCGNHRQPELTVSYQHPGIFIPEDFFTPGR